LNEEQRESAHTFRDGLIRVFNWNSEKISSILDIASRTGECQLIEAKYDEMSKLSKKLVEHKIPFQVKTRK
jgi:hypothetical protein